MIRNSAISQHILIDELNSKLHLTQLIQCLSWSDHSLREIQVGKLSSQQKAKVRATSRSEMNKLTLKSFLWLALRMLSNKKECL